MKHKTQTIDKTQPVELTFAFGEQAKPFVVTGDYESVAPLAERVLSREQRTAPKTRVAPNIGHTLIAQPKRLVEDVLGRVAVDVKAKVYDIQNGTRFYDALQEKRQLEQDLAMAQELGLLAVDVCAKHRKALEDVREIR